MGGSPTYYTVQDGFSAGSGTVGSFSVDQTGHLGQWVDASSYPVANAQLAVMLHTRGQDWSGGRKTYAHHAAAAVRAECTAS